jgi:hypothetical protein
MKKISLYLAANIETLSHRQVSYETDLFFCHICSKASAMSNALISSLSWNLRNSLPPCPVMYTNMFDRSSVRRRLERGTEDSTRPLMTLSVASSRGPAG